MASHKGRPIPEERKLRITVAMRRRSLMLFETKTRARREEILRGIHEAEAALDSYHDSQKIVETVAS